MNDLLIMPDDGVRRWIIDGELREERMDTGELNGQIIIIRNRLHSITMANVATAVNNWRWSLPELRWWWVRGSRGAAAGRAGERRRG